MTFIEISRFRVLSKLADAGELLELSNSLRSNEESAMMIDHYRHNRDEWKRLAWLALTGCTLLTILCVFFYFIRCI